MRKEDFFNGLSFSAEDKQHAERYMFYKGIEKHILIKELLLSFERETSLSYIEIASTYRYDKRIRKELFKYISFIEEFYRSAIQDNFDSIKGMQTSGLKKLIKKHDDDVNRALECLGFDDLLIQMRRLPDVLAKKYIFGSPKNLVQNFKAIRELRNAVMHNKFLLLMTYEECFINGRSGTNLKANIINLANHLPTNIRNQLVEDINACKKKSTADKVTRWILPKQILITL